MNEHLVNSIDEAYSKIDTYENETFSKFYVRGVRSKDFGNAELYSKKRNCLIQWFDALPYISMNQLLFDCEYGPDRHVLFKAELKRKKENKINSDHSQATKTKKLVQCSRKLGCPAKISLKEVFTFPEFKISTSTKHHKNKASKHLRELIQQKDATGVKQFILTFPSNEFEHKMHPDGEGSKIHQTMDKKVRLKIKELVAYAVTNTADIKWYLHEYVTKELFSEASELPSQSNRRFYPSSKDIRNVVNGTLRKLTSSSNEMNAGLAYSNGISNDEQDEEVAVPTSMTTTAKEKDSNVETEKLVEQTRCLSIKGAKVRELLAEILTLSYEISDLSEMESLKDMLEQMQKNISAKIANQKGCTVSQNKQVKLTEKRKGSNHLNHSENRKNLDLPLRKKRCTKNYNKAQSPVSNFNKHDPSSNLVFDGVYNFLD